MKIKKVPVLVCAIGALFLHRLAADTPTFFDGFETRIAPDYLDANYAGGSNTNGPGGANPWWGEQSPNLQIVGAETVVQNGITNTVTPHSGTNMVRSWAAGGVLFTRDILNIAYRFNQSNLLTGNMVLDWWFYDPVGTNVAQRANYADYVSIANFTGIPTNTDYIADETGFVDVQPPAIARLSLGASDSVNVNLRTTNYQAQVLGTTSTNAFDTGNGWFNLSIVRSVGWHHAKISVAPAQTNGTADIAFYIDDMNTPLLTNNATTSNGFNSIVLEAEYSKSLTGWYDDITFNVPPIAPPPSPSISIVGTNAIVTWPGTGFTLQTSTNLSTTNFVDVTNAVSPYTNSATDPQRYFRTRR